MEIHYLVAEELGDMSKKFKAKISQNWLLSCAIHKVAMVIEQTG